MNTQWHHTASAPLALRVDGTEVELPAGSTVAAALARCPGAAPARRSVSGARRQAFCGMGVCGECRVTIDGVPHRLACQVVAVDGMEVQGDE